ncbi:hypothetical protein COT87_02805 [Candidatus Collierbacteria bacterium CG10_big_fil_rev_8_21_14_0_10_44_9]|uniref:OmpR/PhoB-type domain-containing protein n=1 Tax=Candidatus Collierbacteria bacterium CG10_big_fil_rev_8_21_14_0_10_44_9 TaxID=1974535 RepID=A0A2H0VI97_9BACT|nr:MAG: hypothetical protein COT87_02805 [Candidatus Collierbacteria bacterium CG10_big_fil_rev_8_21_14_0_10_44_9]
MKNYPTITFTHSPQLEASRLLHVAGTISHSWFQKHNFLVLPTTLPKVATAQVIFPDLPYSSIPHFWKSVNQLTLSTPQSAPAPLLSATQSLLSPHYQEKLYTHHLSKLKIQWDQVAPHFWNNLFTLFPTYSNRINSLTIISTQYGPYTTFSLAKTPHSNITIYVRQDSTIDRLLWTILTSLFRPKMQTDMHYTWEEIEAVVDWLMSKSALACRLKLSHPTIKNLRAEQIATYRQQSDRYLINLGFTLNAHDITLPHPTTQDQKLLDLLLTKRGQTVSYEDIASVLWTGNDDWSLYAVVKAIERLRRQIKESGIHTPLILAHRKLGYSLI